MRWLTEPLATPRLVVRGVSGDDLTALIVLGVALVGCAGRKDTSGDPGDSSPEVEDACAELFEIEGPLVFRTSGEVPGYETNVKNDYTCDSGETCAYAYILPPSRYQWYAAEIPPDPYVQSELLFVPSDGEVIGSSITEEHVRYFPGGNPEILIQLSRPLLTLQPSTSYEIWRSAGEDLCYDLTMTTSPHGSPISAAATASTVMQIEVDDLHYLFDPWGFYTSLFGGSAGGPDFALQFDFISDGTASVRVAPTAGGGQSWCHATLETVIAVDNHGAFQIPGIPWRGSGSVADYGEFQNLLVTPFTISGHIAPDGQNAIVTLDDVLLDLRLLDWDCDPSGVWFSLDRCPDGELCCMDMSTGPTITEPSPLTSLEYIAQDNCHPFCPTSADNPDCVLP